MSHPPTEGNKVYISNRELYDMILSTQSKIHSMSVTIGTLTATNVLVMAVLAFLTIEGLK